MAFGAKIKLSVNTSGQATFRREIQKYVDSSTATKAIEIKNIKITDSATKKLINDLRKSLKADHQLTIKIKEIDATSAVNKLRKQLETMLSGLSITGLKEFLGAEGVGSAYDKAAASAEKLAQATEVVNQKTAQSKANMQELRNVESMLNSTFKNISNVTGDGGSSLLADYERLNQTAQTLRNNDNERTHEAVSNLAKESIALKQKTKAMLEQEKIANSASNEEIKAAAKTEALHKRAASLQAQINRYIISNSRAYKNYKQEFDAILSIFSNGPLDSVQLDAIQRQYIELTDVCKNAGLAGKTFFDTLQSGWEKFGGWSLVTKSMMSVFRMFKDMVSSVRDLDSAMTELKKVTNETDATYNRFIDTASNMSQKIGASLSDTVNATADFARLGYTIDEATALAEAALVYKNVGDGIEDISEASESIISTIKAFEQFGVSAENAMEIVDKFNEVGNNFAISSQGIGIALQKSASSMATANNNLEETIALITAMNSVVQNPEIVGTALKTVSMYLRTAKTEAEEAGESTDGMANSVSELRDQILTLTDNAVDIMIDDSTFKSTYQIMKELSSVWDTLADVDQSNILELIGGKRNATAVTSLLTNFEDAERALVSANNASGSAIAENEKRLDSINGKLDLMTAKFDTLSKNLIDSGIIKIIISIGNSLLDMLNWLSDINLILPAIATSVILITNTINSSKMQTLANKIVAESSQLKEGTDVLTKYRLAVSSLTSHQQLLLKSHINNAAAVSGVGEATGSAIVGMLNMGETASSLSLISGGLSSVLSKLKAGLITFGKSFATAFKSNPIGWIVTGVSVVSSVISGFKKKADEVEQEAQDIERAFESAVSNIQNVSDGFRNLKSSSNNIIPRFAELARGVNEFGENVSLTDDEYSEFLSLNNQIAEMFPEINMGMDSNGNAMLALSYSANTLTSSLLDLVEAQRQAANQEIADSMPDVISGIISQEDNIEAAKDDLEDRIEAYKHIRSEFEDFASDETQDRYRKTYGDQWEAWYNTDADKIMATMETLLQEFFGNDSLYVDTVKKFIEGERVDWVSLLNSDDVDNVISSINRQLKDLDAQITGVWSQLNPVVNSWIQTDFQYNDLNDQLRDIVLTMAGGLDFSGLGLDTEEEVQDYIKENIIEPIYKLSPEVKDAFDQMTDLRNMLKSGEISESEFSSKISGIFDSLINSLDPVDVEAFESAFVDGFNNAGISGESFTVVVSNLISEWMKFEDVVGQSSTLTNFVTHLDSIKNSFSVFEKAIGEMRDGGVSNDTIKAISELMEEGEDYLDYLVYENGQIGLNTQAWKERALTSLQLDIEKIKEETKSIEDENESLEEQIGLSHELEGCDPYSKSARLVGEYASKIEENNEKIEENQKLLSLYEDLFDSFVVMENVLDFTEMVGGVGEIESEVQSLITAMKSLADGTALTHQELAKLALEYPKLLEASDLFTDGSIAGQRKMLDVILQGYENEYDATIDVKIAELEAANIAYRDRIAAEEDKARIISKIKAEEVNNSVQYAAWLSQQLSKYNDLEGKNYVAYQEGVLEVNKDTLNGIIAQENEKVKISAEDIWQNQATVIADAYVQGGKGGLTALNSTGVKLVSWVNKAKSLFSPLANAIKNALSGVFTQIKDVVFSGVNTNVSSGNIDISSDGSTASIGGKSLDEWTSEQTKITTERINALQSQIQTNLTVIENLKKLKGLDLTSIYDSGGGGSGSGSDSSKTIEEYIADIDEFYAALKRLAKAQEERAVLEKELSNTEDPDSKIKIYDTLIDAYKEEIAAEQNLVNVRSKAIEANVAALRKLGFEVEYNSDTNYLFVKNLEHVNELAATSKGEYETLQEATNALRKETEDLLDITEDWNDSNLESIENVGDLTYEIQNASQEIIDCIEEIYNAQIESYNEIIEKRKEAIESAKEEYDYEEDVAEKVREIAEIQSKIDQLSLDNSRAAQAERNALIEELNEKQKELNETQLNHSADEQIEALDKMAEEYEAEKNAELELLRASIGAVQDLGTSIDERVTNAWKNAKDAVEAYNSSVAGLSNNTATILGTIPKYHTGGVVGSGSSKEEVLALLENGEVVLNDSKQKGLYEIIDFQTELSKRLGVNLDNMVLPYSSIASNVLSGMYRGSIDSSARTVFEPHFNIEINHNGSMSDSDARRYGETIANTAMEKLYSAFERKGIVNYNNTKLKP